MLGQKPTNIMTVDLAAGGALLALVAGMVWYVSGPQRDTYADLERLTSSARKTRGELGQLNAMLEDRRDALASLRDQLTRDGAMPSRTPVEEDLTTLTALAQSNNVRIARVTPLPKQEYPGLLELRYSCEANGTMPNIMGFLRALENHPFWMDISYLDLRQPFQQVALDDDKEEEQSLAFVVSLFSSVASP